MASLGRSTRLLSGTRLTSKQANKTIRSFSVSICSQQHDGQKHKSQRPAAVPRMSRELAAQYHYGVYDSYVKYIEIPNTEGRSRFHPVFLRDACTCPKCVDPSSTQKKFGTTDIPPTLRANSVEAQENGDVTITWQNDIPGFEDHVSTFTAKFLETAQSSLQRLLNRSELAGGMRFWNRSRIHEELQFVNFDDYMKDDKHLYRALAQLKCHGLLLLRNVPESQESVAQIAGRIGTIRDTFYGRTWDVASVPKAQNVAYTNQFLGPHMDLLYMANPPGIQLLHCMKNTCSGGDSLFCDSFHAAVQLSDKDAKILSTVKMAYHYRNAGEHYYCERPVLEYNQSQSQSVTSGYKRLIRFVNYSPPFQAMIPIPKADQGHLFPQLAQALRNFATHVESPRNLYSYRMKEGECVIFNNRRVLHGRQEFESEEGERHLKGTYVDTDVFNSKWRVLNEQFKGDETVPGEQYVNPGALEEGNLQRGARWAKMRKTRKTMKTVDPKKEVVGEVAQ